MLETVVLPAIGALFLWWFLTGAILLVIRRADRVGGDAHHRAALLSVPALALGVALVILSMQGGMVAVWSGFVGALLIWGWIEMTFLSGVITGPERSDCPPDLSLGERFQRSWNALAYHEITLLFGLLLVTVITAGGATAVAFWTYLVLFFARITAKLNLFLGVPRINTEFVPRPLQHLKTHFRRAAPSGFFPLSVTLLTLAFGCFAERAIAVQAPEARTGYVLLAALTGLALLEHWLMVLPLPDAKLWRWMLPTPRTTKTEGENP